MKRALIIALRGENNSGKSHVLRRVFDRLCEMGWKSIKDEYVETRRNGEERTGRVVGKGLEIRGAILEREVGKEKIGLSTLGDAPIHLENFFLPLFAYQCDAYVCATHVRGRTVEIVNDLESSGHKVCWIDRGEVQPDPAKHCSICRKIHGDYDRADRKQADEIIELIYEAIGVAL